MIVAVKIPASEFFTPKYRNNRNVLQGQVSLSEQFIGEIRDEELKDAILNNVILGVVSVTCNLGLIGKVRIDEIPVKCVTPIDDPALFGRATIPHTK